LRRWSGETPARLRRRRRFARALVTGATGGLGRELCRLAAEDGTALVLMDREGQGMGELASELGRRVEVTTREVDFSDLEAVEASARALAEDGAGIDLVLACAGLDRAQSLLRFDWRQARDDFAVNSLANLVLLAGLVPAMAGRGSGHVTAIASLAGLVGMPYEAPYSASKAALASIVESARAELEPSGITFTAVFPGFVDTSMFRANAFKKPPKDSSRARRSRHRRGASYPIPPRDAAERIYMATLRRRETLAFPTREFAKVRLAAVLPARVRDRLTRGAISPPAEIESPPR
jgi:short-subunit dehydrogenase